MIKLKCSNIKCGYIYSVSEIEFKENGQYYTNCLVCGAKNEVDNPEEIVKLDIEEEIKNNIDIWVRDLGWDFIIDLVKKHKDDYSIGRLYVAELKRRGFNLKGEKNE